ncbi:nitronate monooxygenase, partial [Streptomyces alfalfae]
MRTTAAGALGLETSLLQSGMGGVAGTELACAVSEAGAAGCAGGYKLVGGALSAMLERLTAGTDRPVGVNLIPEVVEPAALDRQVAQVLDETPQRVYLSFFGMPKDAVLARLAAAGRRTVVQVGTVEDGVRAAALSTVVVAQGIEAGGHLLGASLRDDLVGALRTLAPEACLVAAGGIGSPAEAPPAVAPPPARVLPATPFVLPRQPRARPPPHATVPRPAAGPSQTTLSSATRCTPPPPPPPHPTL